MTANEDLSDEEKCFLAQCEEEFKHRFTDKDEEFVKVLNSDPPKPPIIEPWYVSHNSGRRNDRRNRRDYSNHYAKHGNRDGGSGSRDHYGGDNSDRRGYNDYNRKQGYYRPRPY